MDTNELNQLIAAACEIEGLLLVVERHGSATPAAVLAALRDKSRRLADALELLELPAPEAAADPAAEVFEPAFDPAPEPCVAEPAPETIEPEPLEPEPEPLEPEPEPFAPEPREAAPTVAGAPVEDDALVVDDQPLHDDAEIAEVVHELFGAGEYVEPAKREAVPAATLGDRQAAARLGDKLHRSRGSGSGR